VDATTLLAGSPLLERPSLLAHSPEISPERSWREGQSLGGKQLSEIFDAVSSTLGCGEFRNKLGHRILFADDSGPIRGQLGKGASQRFEIVRGERHCSSLVRSMEFSRRTLFLLSVRSAGVPSLRWDPGWIVKA
jgi:hypothetical protein